MTSDSVSASPATWSRGPDTCLLQDRDRSHAFRGTSLITAPGVAEAPSSVSTRLTAGASFDPVYASVMSDVRAVKFAVCVAVILPSSETTPCRGLLGSRPYLYDSSPADPNWLIHSHN